jgi:ribonucleoside-triphosphate reductase
MNIGVCTINIPDIALTSKGDKDVFWKLLDERMETLIKPACILRYDKLKGVKAKVAPLLWQYGIFARLNPDDYITDALDKIGYSVSIGYNGEYEVAKTMTGKSHTEKEGFEFVEQVMKFLSDKADKWKSETGIGFSVYQTPQEESTDWFTNKLISKFGIVKDITDKGYITNSYHVDVRENIDVFSKFSIEGKLQKYSKGGNVAYCETGNLEDNIEALYEVIKHMYNTNIHAEINNEGSCKCFKCGYEGKMDYDKETLEFVCPQCKNKDLNWMSIVLRVCGYLSKKGSFIAGRMKDIINRVKHL